jgi:hypothetical protein
MCMLFFAYFNVVVVFFFFQSLYSWAPSYFCVCSSHFCKINIKYIVMYASGHGVEKDPRRSYELYLQAAEGGCSDAMHNLGW